MYISSQARKTFRELMRRWHASDSLDRQECARMLETALHDLRTLPEASDNAAQRPVAAGAARDIWTYLGSQRFGQGASLLEESVIAAIIDRHITFHEGEAAKLKLSEQRPPPNHPMPKDTADRGCVPFRQNNQAEKRPHQTSP